MSTIMPLDHHATFAGWDARKSQVEEETTPWSPRRRISVIAICAVLSWMLVLSPLVLFN